jgi:mRNA interferase MazF
MTEARPRRGEIWRVELDPARGSERAKTRPVVVLNVMGIGRPMMRICAPITHWQSAHNEMFWCVKLEPKKKNGLTKESTVDASQVRALSVERFQEKLGTLDGDDVETVAAAIALCVGYTPELEI